MPNDLFDSIQYYSNAMYACRDPMRYVDEELNKMSKDDVLVNAALQCIHGNNVSLETLVRNICREQGLDVDVLLKQATQKPSYRR